MKSEQAPVVVICDMENLYKLLLYCEALVKISVKGERKGKK